MSLIAYSTVFFVIGDLASSITSYFDGREGGVDKAWDYVGLFCCMREPGDVQFASLDGLNLFPFREVDC